MLVGVRSSEPVEIGRSYFVDCDAGNDTNDGQSDPAPWQTLQRANAALLMPGDRLLLKRTCSWIGPLVVSTSGSSDRPITIGAYGSGAPPQVKNAPDANVQINGSYVVVEQLDARAANPDRLEPTCDNQPVGERVGFRFYAGAAFDTLQDVTASGHTYGVEVDWGTHDVHVLRSELHHNTMMRVLTPGGDDDAGANGVLLLGDNNEVAGNLLHDNIACSFDYGTDGSGVEVDGSSGNRIHHNRSWNNDVFSELGTESAHISDGNVYAYNISSGEHFVTTRGGGRFGPVTHTRIYNSVAYGGGLSCDPGCGPEILTLKNSIIWSEFPLDADRAFDEGYDVYWSGKPGIAISSTSHLADPRFADAANGDFHLLAPSPGLDSGTDEVLAAGFDADFSWTPIQAGMPVSIGAFQD
jgi:hypothetical protein